VVSQAIQPKRSRIAQWLAADTMEGIRRQRALLGYLFIAPSVIGLLIFIIGPMITTFVLSFFEWNVFRPP